MAYTARTLITRSWYLSKIVARNAQTPTGDQINDGLAMLNSILDWKQIETDLIPYWTYIQMPLVAGQEFYTLPYVAAIESSTFNIDVVRYPMTQNSRQSYYGSPRVDNISALPFSYNFNRALGGGELALYFLPQSNYTLKMMVKLFLQDVTLDTDLTNISAPSLPYTFVNSSNQGLDTSYIEYLRYYLAMYMCSEYGVEFADESKQIMKSIERTLMYVSPPDLKMNKASILNANATGTLNWAFVNLAYGWVPA